MTDETTSGTTASAPPAGTGGARDGRITRLTSDDALFVVMERVLGVPVTNQLIWRLPAPQEDAAGDSAGDPASDDHATGAGSAAGAGDRDRHGARRVDDAAVAELGAALRRGRLARLVRRSHGPTRDRWVYDAGAGLVRTGLPTVPAGGEGQWIRDQLRLRLDSVAGPAWALTTAPTADGGRLVSLSFSHVIADGRGAVTAVVEALTGREAEAALPAGPGPTVAASLRDAASLVGDAAVSAVRLVRSSLRAGRGGTGEGGAAEGGAAEGGATEGGAAEVAPHTAAPSSVPAAAGAADDTAADASTPRTDSPAAHPGLLPTIAVEVDGPRFAAAAAAAGGTTNTLFAAVTLGVLAASGRVADGATVPVSLPVSLRGDHDLRANATSGATAHVVVSPDRYTDLTPIRAASKAGFRRITAGEFSAVDAMTRIAQALPDGVVRRLAGTASTPLCLASNLGVVDPLFASLGGPDQGRTAIRSVSVPDGAADRDADGGDGPAADGDLLRSGGISAWATLAGTRLSLCFTALDTSLIPDEDRLTALVSAELDRWDVTATRWL
ncbi:hypothetical protein QDW14_09680 [Corynebacterium bovis]|uniref:hypothetical protein n=1 Tax=Corynebacterium bovis TaxID=36808 RepID=UPI002449C7C9|nr:hypothetical protein [Corynebacterium bovis]MDH2456733.1 hypothetical protein [Corynebacterium bovis]